MSESNQLIAAFDSHNEELLWFLVYSLSAKGLKFGIYFLHFVKNNCSEHAIRLI
jgi:hypothetical protein